MTGVFQQITRGFIWWAGITRPKPGKEAIARYYILGILTATIVMLFALFFTLQNIMR